MPNVLFLSLSCVVLHGTVDCDDPTGFLQSTAEEWLSEAQRLSSLYVGREYSISSLEIFIALLASSNTHEPPKSSSEETF